MIVEIQMTLFLMRLGRPCMSMRNCLITLLIYHSSYACKSANYDMLQESIKMNRGVKCLNMVPLFGLILWIMYMTKWHSFRPEFV